MGVKFAKVMFVVMVCCASGESGQVQVSTVQLSDLWPGDYSNSLI